MADELAFPDVVFVAWNTDDDTAPFMVVEEIALDYAQLNEGVRVGRYTLQAVGEVQTIVEVKYATNDKPAE